MTSAATFLPNWTSSPGETIKDILTEKDISHEEFGLLMYLPQTQSDRLLRGEFEISSEVADKLAQHLGATATFWLTRDSLYRSDLARIRNIETEGNEWLKKLPLRDMIRHNWIHPNSGNRADKFEACLDFFEVNSVDHWYKSYNDLLCRTAFRTSESFDSDPESVVSWLQQGMVESRSLECSEWDKGKFSSSLDVARSLSRIKDPKIFLPKLQELFRMCGVALVIVRTPSKCHASGATLSLSEDKRLMILSFRYLTDDHFWFSLFHEAGHLLLHDPEILFLEGTKLNTNEEFEANEFSAKRLVPNEFGEELKSLNHREWRNIVRFAKKIGVSTGIVVGQLQHLGIVRRDYLNKLKTRYKWSG